MPSRLKHPAVLAALALLALGLLWSYWPTLVDVAERWADDPQYSHGYLVPLFALFLLWQRRRELAATPLAPSWWGVLLLLGAGAMRLAGGYYFLPWLDQASLLPALAGLFVLAGGWPALRWAWLPIAFLAFMLPLPFRLQVALAHPLQQVATVASTYLLEMAGLPAVARGNVILINDAKIGVVEACNGLGMLMTFLALSAAVAALSRPSWLERSVILLSAVPVALAANVLRIAGTAVLHERVGGEAAGVFFHDLAGWFMMPVGLGLLGLELLAVRKLIVEDRPSRDGPIALGSPWHPTAGEPAPPTPQPVPPARKRPRKKSGRTRAR